MKRRRSRRTLGEQSAFFFNRKPKSNCGALLKFWADQRGLPVRSTASVHTGADNKRGQHSELCMQTRCAGKPVRAFAYNPTSGTAAIAYMEGNNSCQFNSGSATELLPVAFWKAAGVGGRFEGARRRAKKRRR
jgi:hypothetical protein